MSGHEGIHGSKIKGPCRACCDADWQLTDLKAIYAHGAFLRLNPKLIALKHRSTVLANIITYPASITPLAVYQNSTIFLLFEDSFLWAVVDTNRLLTVVTGNPKEMNPYVGKRAPLIFIYPQVLKRTWRESVPVLTSHGTRMAA
jgi:hypothetical protein